MALNLIKGITPKEIAGFQVYSLVETGSTNTDALALAEAGAPGNIALTAQKQTKGRGRMDRQWEGTPGQSLALSLLIRPSDEEQANLFRFTALAGLALLDVFESKYGLKGQLKWPNDVLLNGAKVCGILTETLWSSDFAEAVVVGIGVNVGLGSHPPSESLRFRASSLEAQLGYPVSVDEVLTSLLTRLSEIRPEMGSKDFILKWNEKLAYVGEKVQIANEKGEIEWFRLIGVQDNAALLVEDEQGTLRQLYSSEIRPATL